LLVNLVVCPGLRLGFDTHVEVVCERAALRLYRELGGPRRAWEKWKSENRLFHRLCSYTLIIRWRHPSLHTWSMFKPCLTICM
jgi:hypothetical protein